MINHIAGAVDNEYYRSPSVKVVPVNAVDLLCLSGTERMGYEDLEDGGFH